MLADLERDLRELGLLGLHRAGAAVDDPLAEPELAGVQGDVDVLVEVLRRQAAADPRRAGALLGHADDRVVVGPELDRLADRVLVGEERLGRLRGEDGVVLVLLVVRLGQEPPALDLRRLNSA